MNRIRGKGLNRNLGNAVLEGRIIEYESSVPPILIKYSS